MKKIFYLLLLCSLLSCSSYRTKYFVNFSDGNFDSYLKQELIDSLVIDNSYTFYIREICRERPKKGYYYSQNPNLTAAVDRCNCLDPTITFDKERLEIQYLLISEQHQKFVYITTVPPSENFGKTTYDQSIFSIPNYININYFNTFFFGDIKDHTLNFETDNPTQILKATTNPGMKWIYNKESSDNIRITKVYSIRTGDTVIFDPVKTIQPDFLFYKRPKFDIGISDDLAASELNSKNNNFLKNNTIYFLNSLKSDEKRVEKISFTFDTSHMNSGKYKKLYFPAFRLKSSPIIN